MESPMPADPASPEGAAPLRQGLLERFEDWLPAIQQRWPEVARSTLEASRGSFDELADTIAAQSGRTAAVVKQQLLELIDTAGSQTGRLAGQLEPLEAQLESLLDDLNATLRPRIEKPVRERPLLAIGIAAGVGVVLGLLLAGGRRSR
jgi:ElaB/YqjD/DUF883 family membrane-anchored ribosome-binding protein